MVGCGNGVETISSLMHVETLVLYVSGEYFGVKMK
jgi:hypothetical protein